MKLLKTVALGIVMLATPHISGAAPSPADSVETIRPVIASYTIGWGSSRLADTYLSPLKYKGWGAELRYERWQAAKFAPEDWVMQLNVALGIDRCHNLVGNAAMWQLGANATWGLARRWKLPYSLTVGAGALLDVDAGCIYNRRNSNNPVAAKASATVDLTAYVTWSAKLLNTPVTLRYQPAIPLTGVFFSPDYDELYYEIYLGNHSGLAHAAWWGNFFKMSNMLTADFRVSNTAVRIGYRSLIFSSKVSNITTRDFTNMLVIGLSGEWISLSPRREISRHARYISSFY